MKGFFQSAEGRNSIMRLQTFLGVCTGIALCAVGAVGFFMGRKDSFLIITAGAGLITGSHFFKGWQKKSEGIDAEG